MPSDSFGKDPSGYRTLFVAKHSQKHRNVLCFAFMCMLSEYLCTKNEFIFILYIFLFILLDIITFSEAL